MSGYDPGEYILQAPPFRFVDRIDELDGERYASGRKFLDPDDAYFSGHFPGYPIMPGVLIAECCAQLASACVAKEGDSVGLLLKIEKFRFKKAAFPGDTLKMRVRKASECGKLVAYACEAEVNGKPCAEGLLTFAVESRASLDRNRES